jgi:hypothetical protein
VELIWKQRFFSNSTSVKHVRPNSKTMSILKYSPSWPRLLPFGPSVFHKYEPLSDGFEILEDIQINMGKTALKKGLEDPVTNIPWQGRY